jgi:hypothetical protein
MTRFDVDLERRLFAIDATTSDGVIALRLADYLTDAPGQGGYYRLSVIYDRTGGVPTLPHTGRHKNALIFKTRDREAARGWIVQAALAGHCVMRTYCSGKGNLGGGKGTIPEIRERAPNYMRPAGWINAA